MKNRPISLLAATAIAALFVATSFAPAGTAETASLRERLLAAPLTNQLGGETSRPITGETAFAELAGNAIAGRQRPFSFGNRLFNTNWAIAPGSVKSFDGLGPIFNRVSCSGCHTRDGRGRPPEPGESMESMLIRLSIPGIGPNGGVNPHPVYGDQLGEKAIPGVTPEGQTRIAYAEIPGAYGDGTPYSLRKPDYNFENLGYGPLGDDILFSPRTAQAVFGLGLLESVPESDLAALADPDDADGDAISGRMNLVHDPASGTTMVGRFGWKANVPTIDAQNAGAAFGDIGLTSATHPDENCSPAQTDCADQLNGGSPDLPPDFLARLAIYVRLLAVPEARLTGSDTHKRGEDLFHSFGCAACHMPTLETGANADFPELANQTIHPFTDLLLHDMGPDLADSRPDFDASGSEWRTAPLWGLGMIKTVSRHDFLLHDGRARGPAEAILWHGGEAEAAREAFRNAPKADREALLAFLDAL